MYNYNNKNYYLKFISISHSAPSLFTFLQVSFFIYINNHINKDCSVISSALWNNVNSFSSLNTGSFLQPIASDDLKISQLLERRKLIKKKIKFSKIIVLLKKVSKLMVKFSTILRYVLNRQLFSHNFLLNLMCIWI